MIKSISKNNFKTLFFSCIIALIFCLTKCHISYSFFKRIIEYLSIIISISIYLIYIKRNKYSKFVITFLLYLIVLILATLLNSNASINIIMKIYFLITAVIMYFDIIDFKKESSKYIIKGWYYAFYLITLINFITIIVYPNGMYKNSIYTNNWFLGYDNTHICFFYSTILFMFLDKYLSKRKYKLFDFTILVLITIQVFYCFSANSIVSFIVFIFLTSLFTIKRKNKNSFKLNIKNFYLINLLFNLFFVVLRIQEKFEWLIVGVLGKKLDFSGRTVIWDKVVSLIRKQTFIGYGQEPVEIISNKLGNAAFAHAHNTILDITYKSGLLGLCLHSALHIQVIKELYSTKNNKLAIYVSILLFSFIILTIMEARQENFNLYLVLIIAFNIKKIIKGEPSNE